LNLLVSGDGGQVYFVSIAPARRATTQGGPYNSIPFSNLWKGEEQLFVRVAPNIPGVDFVAFRCLPVSRQEASHSPPWPPTSRSIECSANQRIADADSREATEISVRGPQLAHSMFLAKGGHAGVVHLRVAMPRLPRIYSPRATMHVVARCKNRKVNFTARGGV
jgi:hypothetical protein